MLDQGVYLAPSQFEAAFVSLAHTEEIIDQTIAAAQESLSSIGRKGHVMSDPEFETCPDCP